MRMSLLLMLLLSTYHYQEIEAGKSKFLKGLKKIFFGDRTKTNTDNPSKPPSDIKPTKVAPSYTAPSIPSETSSYQPQIPNQRVPAAISVDASTISTQPAGYRPPIPSMSLGTSAAGSKGSAPPLTATTKSSTDDGQVIANAATFVAASHAAGYDPSASAGTGIPIDLSGVGVGGDGGGAGAGAGSSDDSNILTSCLCGLAGCLKEIFNACDPTQCCCCVSVS